MRTYTVNTPEYAAHMNVRHWETLKRLKIVDGEIVYDTGAILHPIADRIAMFEEDHNRPEYKFEIELIADEYRRQNEHLRTL